MARLNRVTITGADDSCQPQQLAELSKDFPFVEWGILVHHHVTPFDQRSNRFPSRLWFEQMQEVSIENEMQMSLHVCGRWVRRILLGTLEMPITIFDGFQRVQLNFHAEKNICKVVEMTTLLKKLGRQFIFQIDDSMGNAHMSSILEMADPANVVPLFDVSGGAGILPNVWPNPQWQATPDKWLYHGYAGGLGPQNLAIEIPKILEASFDARIWIDMETRVRSESDRIFDLKKVRKCLELAEPFISL